MAYALGMGGAEAAPTETWQQRLVAQGPWPPAGMPPAAAANPLAPRPEALELGYRLFRETRFSANGYIGCVSCHQTDRAFTDGIARAQGIGPSPLNAPSLLNLAWMPRFGWQGNSASLTESSLRPLLDPHEHASDARRVAHTVRVADGLACRWERVFAVSPQQQDDQAVLRRVTQTIALFTAQLSSARTPFDDWRDTLARGQPEARYPAAARRGAILFAGRAACIQCHAGPVFSDGQIHRVEPGAVAMRTPPLRQVSVSAPYWHDGSATTLADAVRRHRSLKGVPDLTDAELVDLSAFMDTLTDGDGARRQFPSLARSPCPSTASGG
ncbi:MAG: cytochrome-c peroxidase [Aquabacterium sp.]